VRFTSKPIDPQARASPPSFYVIRPELTPDEFMKHQPGSPQVHTVAESLRKALKKLPPLLRIDTSRILAEGRRLRRAYFLVALESEAKPALYQAFFSAKGLKFVCRSK
jgi:hypothetical protein